jgi:hypothetical protein
VTIAAGVVRWYQYLVQFVVFELNRIIRAINVPRPAFLVSVATPATAATDQRAPASFAEVADAAAEPADWGSNGVGGIRSGDSGSLDDVPQDLLLGGGGGNGIGGSSEAAGSPAASKLGSGVVGGAQQAVQQQQQQQPLVQARFSTGGLIPQTRVVEMQRPAAALQGSRDGGSGSSSTRDTDNALLQRPEQASSSSRSSGGLMGFVQAGLDQVLDSAAAGSLGAGGVGGAGGGRDGTVVQSSSSARGDPQLLAGLGGARG